ncbi:MAG: biotin--[acetyl-CoA-carboxylase] ligase [Thermodesulfovibrionales bacterium]|jgi:BirA family biotin operon repressor/biotin-[acetyl-CoA-carboxylase] ligase|nr:biotin--[acetyl-CoA-carboxylase] ligase [Thermodesulfovibrionales bacterium]
MNNNGEIIRLLKEKEDFISGAEMANTLKITRAAVWKRINILREKGYTIEASPAKGYKLLKSPDLSIEEIRDSISGRSMIIGREIIFFDTINSTNTCAMELAEKGYPDGTIIIADAQTGGKGRLGRKWLSPQGKNLYMSIILRPAILPRDAAILTLMTAVACASAIKRISSIPASIKWPNDLMVSDRKLGGILTEIKADMDRIFHAVIGIGININLGASDMPDEIKACATSIKNETGNVLSRTKVAVEILREMDKWYSILLNSGKKPIIEEWLKLSCTIGRAVKVTVGNNVFTGIAGTIDEEGMLMLKLPDNTFKKISAGDVIILR